MKDIEYQEVEDYVIQLKNNNVKVIEYKHFKDKFNLDRKSTRLNSSHANESRMPSSA